MSKLKYPEKKYLSTYELSLNFFNELGIKVVDITPLRKVFILKTKEGNKILKKVDYDQNRIEFINKCVENIGKEFKNIISFKRFKDGNTYKEWRGNYYVVMDLIPGREAAFTNPLELNMCSELVAKMHLVSRGIVEKKKLKSKLDISLSEKFNEYLEVSLKIRDLISNYKYKNKFDMLYSAGIDNYIEDIRKSIDLLDSSGYEEYRNKTSNIVICHNDLAEHNFLVSNNEIYLIDFDYCSIDLRIMDLADLLLRGIKNAAFSKEKAKGVIESYNKIYPLDSEEYKILYAVLSFPRDMFNLGTSYYYKQKNWEEDIFINRLMIKLQNEELRKEFLNEYKKEYKI